MNYFELYPGDYLRDTTRLSLIDHGAYVKMLMGYYGEEQPLPAAYTDLFVMVAAVTPADKAAVKKIADRYFPIAEDGLRHNTRADAEIAKARKRIRTARENGAKNKARNNPPAMPAGYPAGMPGDTQRVTHSGEALQNPGPTRKATTPSSSSTPERCSSEESLRLGVGTSAGSAAAALNRRGVKVTSMNPNLIEACNEGVTEETLLELHSVYPDKPAAYLIATARRIHAERATPALPSTSKVTPINKPSAADNFRGNFYAGTPISQLPPTLRAAAEAALTGNG